MVPNDGNADRDKKKNMMKRQGKVLFPMEDKKAQAWTATNDIYGCSQWGVVTTIFRPTVSIFGVANLKGWCLVIVGDTITPDGAYVKLATKPNVHYLSASYQQEFLMRNAFVQKMPFKSFARKNIGYLFAITYGARVIYDFDDDNILMPLEDGTSIPPPFHFDDLGLDRTILLKYKDEFNEANKTELAFNPYIYTRASHKYSWPRGFPIDQLKENFKQWDNLPNQQLQYGDIPLSSVGVLQSLCNGDPDNDAIFRMTRPGSTNFTFDHSATALPLLVPSTMYSPYNAQATTHLYSTFWGLYLPISVPGRVTDIWRSYITQRIMKDLKLYVVFTPPIVVHERSAHDYLSDFVAEGALYDKASKLLDFLAAWSSDAGTLPERIFDLWIELYERDYIELHDVNAVLEWLKTLQEIGYEFPEISGDVTRGTSASVIRPQPNLVGQPYRALPFFKGRADLAVDPKVAQLKGDSWVERPDSAVVKVIIMTMDEWPLIKAWVLYHGHLLGFDKLYIIDSSTDSRCISFLRYARDTLGANVLFNDANLNQLVSLMTEIARNVGNSADFILKVDTDEFLVAHDIQSKNVTPGAVADYLSGFAEHGDHPLRTVNGHSRVGFLQRSIPSKVACDRDIYSTPDKFLLGPLHIDPVSYKAVFDSRLSPVINLGGHAIPPSEFKNSSNFGILHFHSRCIDVEVEVAKRVIIRHNFLAASDGRDIARAKLAKMCKISVEDNFCNSTCQFNGVSNHKVKLYMRWLDCEDSMKETYYNGIEGRQNVEFVDFMQRSISKFTL
jgi:hypothetical protein